MQNKLSNVQKITYSGLLLALAMFLPFLTGQIPEIGSKLSPMHLPVLLCGFICGWQYGLIVGFIAPLLRFAVFGMPPIMPTGIGMAFELAAYGAFAAVFYKIFPKKTKFIYLSLILTMLIGRVVWGVTRFILAGVTSSNFTFAMFIAGAFVNAVPAIVCQIILIPILIVSLRRANILSCEEKNFSDKVRFAAACHPDLSPENVYFMLYDEQSARKKQMGKGFNFFYCRHSLLKMARNGVFFFTESELLDEFKKQRDLGYPQKS